jgi:hypothetical protein
MTETQDILAPGLLTGNGVTLAQVEAFARAAVSFFEAISWRLLSGGDLVHIEASEEVEPVLRCVVIRRLREGIALSFFRDEAGREAFRDNGHLGDQWVLSLLPLWVFPCPMRISGSGSACPCAARTGSVRRPCSFAGA